MLQVYTLVFPMNMAFMIFTEAGARICSIEKVFLTISQNSQEAPVPEFLF